jgi:hypothetical protein
MNATARPTANDPRIQYLEDRIAKLRQRIAESPGLTDDSMARIECYQKSLDNLRAAAETPSDIDPSPDVRKNHPENAPSIDSKPLAGGQPADKPRTDAGQTSDTDRTASGQNADKTPIRTPLEKDIIEQLNQSSKSPLDQLPPDLQEHLYDLITHYPITTVHRTISLPAPEGWGLSTSRQSLYRFQDRFAEMKLRERRRQLKHTAKSILEDLQGAEEQFTSASESLLKVRLLETANDSRSKTRDIRDLFTTLIRLRAAAKSRQPSATDK